MARDEQTQAGFFNRIFAADPTYGMTAIGVGALAVFLSFLLAGLWNRYEPHILANHLVAADSIRLVPQPPPWIKCDIKNEVVEAAGLSGLHISEEQLTLRFYEAFRTHSWVAKVRRVGKRPPANIVVELDYRRPVAMVEVADRNVEGQFYEGGLYPVDETGVLLPTADFSVKAAQQFPRIVAQNAAPMAPPGALWGDQRIHQAAMLAAVLDPYWKKLSLYRIVAIFDGPNASGGRDIEFRLVTRNSTIVLWGHGPGKETATEASVAKKIGWLLKLQRDKGSLDSVDPDRAIDVRDDQNIEMAVRPADSVRQ